MRDGTALRAPRATPPASSLFPPRRHPQKSLMTSTRRHGAAATALLVAVALLSPATRAHAAAAPAAAARASGAARPTPDAASALTAPRCTATVAATPAWATTDGARAASLDVVLSNPSGAPVAAPYEVMVTGPYARALQAWNLDVARALAVNGSVAGSAEGYWQVGEREEGGGVGRGRRGREKRAARVARAPTSFLPPFPSFRPCPPAAAPPPLAPSWS